MNILSPTGHLGFTPIERGSFEIGVTRRPDAIVADSGSCDIGPQPLGADEHCSPEEWQRHDLELMLLAARRLGVPMIVGSASDAGTDRGVNQYAEIVRELARRHRLAPFNLATIFSEVSRDEVARRLRSGVRIEGLDGRADLTPAVLARTDRLVAVMGVEPIIQALGQGADVVIAGRSGDSCLFAAPAIRAGFPEASAYYLGKVLECASFAAEPFMGKESILGTVTADAVSVTAMHPGGDDEAALLGRIGDVCKDALPLGGNADTMIGQAVAGRREDQPRARQIRSAESFTTISMSHERGFFSSSSGQISSSKCSDAFFQRNRILVNRFFEIGNLDLLPDARVLR